MVNRMSCDIRKKNPLNSVSYGGKGLANENVYFSLPLLAFSLRWKSIVDFYVNAVTFSCKYHKGRGKKCKVYPRTGHKGPERE